jgi:hypothetical protein
MGDDPDILVTLTTARTEFEGSNIVAALEARGIPARVYGLAGTALGWEIASTDPICVVVRRADLAAARAALSLARDESVDIDWNDVDVGEPVDETVHRGSEAPAESPGAQLRWLVVVALVLVLLAVSAARLR